MNFVYLVDAITREAFLGNVVTRPNLFPFKLHRRTAYSSLFFEFTNFTIMVAFPSVMARYLKNNSFSLLSVRMPRK